MLLSNLGFKYFWFTLLYGALVVSAFRATRPQLLTDHSQRDAGRAAAPASEGRHA